MYCIAYIIHVFSDENSLGVKRKTLVVIFVAMANFVTIFSVSKEIVETYDRKIQNVYSQQSRAMKESLSAPSAQRSLDRKASVASQDTIRSLRNKSSISLSIFWLIYSVILLIVGIFGKYKGVRIGGLALLMLAILKLFFVDLWSLGTLYRIISSISLGVVLLSISFVYQKHKDFIKQII